MGEHIISDQAIKTKNINMDNVKTKTAIKNRNSHSAAAYILPASRNSTVG